MMGCKKKRGKLFKTFVRDGFSEEELNRVHCPIGLEIRAETPVEIAFGIVSQPFSQGLDLRDSLKT
jgi:xanthine dehydrogenase accessory factor